MTLAVGTYLGRYQICSQLGAGGMGEVYLARNPKINRNVAIKVLPAALASDSENQPIRFDRAGKQLGSAGTPGLYFDIWLSPDENKAAVNQVDSQTGANDIWLIDLLRGVPSRFTTNPASDTNPLWSPDGRELFYISGDRKLMSVATKLGATFEAGVPKALFDVRVLTSTDFRNLYVASADGQRFLVNSTLEQSDVRPFSIVLNWTADLKR